MRRQIHWIPKSNPLDSKTKPIGFQNQTHWVSKPNPLGFKTKSIGFQNQIHWILRAIGRVLGVKASRLVSAFRLQWSTISLYPRARRGVGGGGGGRGGEAGGRWRCGGCGVWRGDGRVWSLSNDGEESPHPSVGGGGEVVGVRWRGRWAMWWVWGVAVLVVGGGVYQTTGRCPRTPRSGAVERSRGEADVRW